MSDTPFKSPYPYKKTKRSNSDSDESIISEAPSTNSGSVEELSTVALFDEQQRLYQQRVEDRDNLHDGFLHFAEQTKLLYEDWAKAISECVRLRNEIDSKIEDGNEANRLLKNARKMLDEEHKKRKWAEQERDELQNQIAKFCNALVKDSRNKLVDDAKEQISSLYTGRMSFGDPDRLSAIKEVNSTGSILSDFSFSRSEDDLDSSRCLHRPNKEWSKRQQTDKLEEPANKKRKSASNKAVDIGPLETVRATTTLTVKKDGPITATSVIESIPKSGGEYQAPPDLVFKSWAKQEENARTPLNEPNSNFRQHFFQQKTVVMPNLCSVCEKHLRFGKTAYKCKECRLMCHSECKEIMRTPCVPIMNTPRKFTGTVADYTPTSPPMVPALIVHCISEIEQRGLNELGIYRIPGSEKDVKGYGYGAVGSIYVWLATMLQLKETCIMSNNLQDSYRQYLDLARHCMQCIAPCQADFTSSEINLPRLGLKEKFLSNRHSPNLKEVDIHVICGCVKDFLRSLTEPLITYNLWNDFITAVRARDPNDVAPALYETISKLPQPNRDTMAYIILHLQKVSQSPECKMPADNLAKVFGPTLVGYSSGDTDPNKLLEETKYIVKVMSHLLNIPSDFWTNFINVCVTPSINRLQQTPSTDSLLRPTASRFLRQEGGPIRNL